VQSRGRGSFLANQDAEGDPFKVRSHGAARLSGLQPRQQPSSRRWMPRATIIGSEVNLASRLQSHAELGGILLSHETYSLVKELSLAASRAIRLRIGEVGSAEHRGDD
jgi:hypothetical protein